MRWLASRINLDSVVDFGASCIGLKYGLRRVRLRMPEVVIEATAARKMGNWSGGGGRLLTTEVAVQRILKLL